MATKQTEIVNDLVDNVKLLLSSDTSLESLKEIELCVKQNRIDLEKIELSKITGLKEQLALKTNIADIIDNLTSTLVDAPLSANQGRVLSEKVKVASEAIESIKTVLTSDDTSLDELQELVNYIKQNKNDLSTLDLSNIAETSELKHFTKVLKEKLENLPSKIELSGVSGLEEALALKVNIVDIIDNLTSTLVDAPLSANQGKILSEKIESIKTVLVSDDTSLDELQELVNYIKQNKNDLSTLDLSNIAETDTLKHFTKVLKEKLENLPSNDVIQASSIPRGFILINPTRVIPNGFLECNGAVVSRKDYSDLFKVIGTLYGSGNGSTTFNLPDLRGEFIRGLDNGRGVDNSRTIGSFQEDAFQGHGHNVESGFHGDSYNSRYGGGTTSKVKYPAVKEPISDGKNGTPRIDNETRPRNIAMVYCIKY